MARRVTKAELSGRVKELETELALLKQAYLERMALGELALDSIDEAYYRMDLKGNIVTFNRAAAGLLGYAPEELMGLGYREYTSGETAGRMYEIFHRIYETGEPQRMVDYEVIRKDKTRRIHELSAGLVRDGSGRPAGFHVLVRDVTEQRLMKERLEWNERLYRTILENTGTATVLIDRDRKILFANANFAGLTGYAKE